MFIFTSQLTLLLASTISALAAAANASALGSQAQQIGCADRTILSTQMVAGVNMTTYTCLGRSRKRQQSLNKRVIVENVCAPQFMTFSLCQEFTGTVNVSDCAIIHNALLVLESAIGNEFTIPTEEAFALTQGTCEYVFENASPNSVQYCWQDAWAVVGSILSGDTSCFTTTTNGAEFKNTAVNPAFFQFIGPS